MDGPKKILFVIPSLCGGGAEKVAVLLSKHLDRDKFLPEFALFSGEISYPQDLRDDVQITVLNKNLIISLAKVIRDQQPALILSFLHWANYRALLASLVSRRQVPVIPTDHVNLTTALRQEKLGWVKGLLIRHLYPRAARLICVSQGIKTDLIENYRVPAEKCAVIYNPIETDRITALAREAVDHPWFHEELPVLVACGRLMRQKNYPLLLRALKLLEARGPVRLAILGAGEDLPKLEAYAGELGISPLVAFLGFQENPFKFVARAAALVLSSSWEGFGNVLIEAMACGTPVVSTRCPSGPEEIITPEENGLLVPMEDDAALAAAISRLLADEPWRQKLAAAGKRRAEDFRVEKIVGEYEAVFSAV